MDSFRILLTHLLEGRTRRRCRRELIQFTDSLALYLGCGFDLAHSWNESISGMLSDGPTRHSLTLRDPGTPFSEHLEHLASTFPMTSLRQWFGILRQSYVVGSPIIPLIRAFSESMRRDQLRDFEQHARTLPTRANVLLLIFFLPPALLIIFGPLLSQLK